MLSKISCSANRRIVRAAKKCISLTLTLCICTTLIVSAPAVKSKAASDSFTNTGVGPLYWCSYEDSFTNNAPISQSRFLSNVDWVASNFKSYGYNMVCTDGWIEDSTKTDSNGYVTSYNDNWTYTWKDLYNYCQNDGLNLGVYYNPLWITPAAVADSSKTVIGTSYKISDIVDTSYVYTGYNPQNLTGDRFNYAGGSGNNTLYWLDVEKPGAEQYVKGYVDYFSKIGVKFLRIDFLSWFESGMDHGSVIGKDHGTADYNTALQWIYQEAQADGVEISLVMPNLNNNASTELQYGDMARVNEDCSTGGWNRFSDMNKGTRYGSWSQLSNAFDGLIYWSQYFGKGKMISDADMLRLNTFSNDSERQSAVSLCALSGAPIDIADQYDTIGSSAWIYQNTELLSLRSQNFVAKPFSADINNVKSEYWKGQLPDGSWVVGLFNRESTAQTRSINFATDLGLTGSASVHDMWAHTDLGSMTSYSISLAPHACMILHITGTQAAAKTGVIVNPGFENGDITGWTATGSNFGVNSSDVYSGAYKCYFWSTNSYTQKLEQTVTGLANGTYTVSAMVKQNTGTPNVCQMQLSGYGGSTVYSNIPSSSGYQTIYGTATVTNGQLNIAFYEDAPANTNLQIDDVQIAPCASVTNPGFETGNISGWTATGSNYGVDSNDVYSGNYKCYFWGTSAYTQKINQTVTIPNGTYTISAMVQQDAGTPNTCQMQLSNYDSSGSKNYVNIPHCSSYTQVSGSVTVTNGQLNIAFYEDSPGSTNLQIDNVTLVPSGRIENGDFENGDISGWVVTGANYGVDAADVYQGSYKCYFWSTSSFTQKIAQTVIGLPNGTHTITAWVKQNTGTPTLCRMELSNYGGSTVYSNVPHGGSTYTQISGTVNVTNGEVNIAFYESAPGYTNLQIDNVQIN